MADLPAWLAEIRFDEQGLIPAIAQDQAYLAWKFPQAALTGLLPQQQPFRKQTATTVSLVWLPDADGEQLLLHGVGQGESKGGQAGRQRHRAHAARARLKRFR